MGRKKPKWEDKQEQSLESKILVTISVDFTVDTVLNSDLTPEQFGNAVIHQLYKTLPYDERNSRFTINKEVLDELTK